MKASLALGLMLKSLAGKKNAITATELVTTPETADQDVEIHGLALLVAITETDRTRETEAVVMTVGDLHPPDTAGEAQTGTKGEEMLPQDVITTVIIAHPFAEDPKKKTRDVSLLNLTKTFYRQR